MAYQIFLVIMLMAFTSLGQSTDSLEQVVAQGSTREKVIALNELYKLYANNDPARAMEYTRQALKLASESGDQSGIASSYNNMGVIYKNQGAYDLALDNYLKSVRIQEEQHFQDALAFTYNNIGTIYSLQGEYQKALEYFNKATDQFESIGHDLMVIGSLNNIGNVYTAMGENDMALKYYLQSLGLYEELEDNSKAFVPFINIGNIYFSKEEYENALAYYGSAYDLEKIKNDLNGQANALLNMGLAQKVLADYERAAASFNEGIELAQQTDNRQVLTELYEALAENYFASGDMFLAYSYMKFHTTAKDSLFNEQSAKRLAELENAYELEKKENEIKSLRMESEVQQLQLSNNKIMTIAIVIISLLGLLFTLIIIRELRKTRRNKKKLEEQHHVLEQQKAVIDEKNTSITESIAYAKSVQVALLQHPIPEVRKKNYFIYFKPKDIVSGDFHWYAHHGGQDIIAAADCTGHGIAGAFMTVIGTSALDQVVNREGLKQPAQILKALNSYVSEAINSAGKKAQHGMDVGLLAIDFEGHKVSYAGANRPLLQVNSAGVTVYKGDHLTIGDNETEPVFKQHDVSYQPGDTFYIFSDGFADQFGGRNDKKFMLKNFKNLLSEIYQHPMAEQQAILAQRMAEWMAGHDQTDDMLVIGVNPSM